MVEDALDLMLGTLNSASLSSRHHVYFGCVEGVTKEVAVLLSHVLAHDPVLKASFSNENLVLFLVEILFRIFSQVEDLVGARRADAVPGDFDNQFVIFGCDLENKR